MNSVEKVYEALEQLADADDDELVEAFAIPIQTTVVRAMLPAIAGRVPQDPAELDLFLTNVGNFCHSLRSDPVPADVTR